MSNIAMFNPSNVPAFARNAELSATTLALAGGVNNGGGMKRVIVESRVEAALQQAVHHRAEQGV